MTFDSWPELFGLAGSFLASVVALVRFSLNQHRALADRFIAFLESALKRQEEANARFQETLERLTENVQENSALLTRIAKG